MERPAYFERLRLQRSVIMVLYKTKMLEMQGEVLFACGLCIEKGNRFKNRYWLKYEIKIFIS
jgi:hypothetical protein